MKVKQIKVLLASILGVGLLGASQFAAADWDSGRCTSLILAQLLVSSIKPVMVVGGTLMVVVVTLASGMATL